MKVALQLVVAEFRMISFRNYIGTMLFAVITGVLVTTFYDRSNVELLNFLLRKMLSALQRRDAGV